MRDEESKIKHTDFNRAFEELYLHQLIIPGTNIRSVFEVREIGELVLTSGKLFAYDFRNPLIPDFSQVRKKYLNYPN